MPDRLAFYDYIGHNPAKGGLFRPGAQINGDGLVVGWLGHPSFVTGSGTPLFSRRMPSFFETFPVLFVNSSGTVVADQPFRRAEAKYALESVKLRVTIHGGALDGVQLTSPVTVSALARTAQFGELLDFDRESVAADGVSVHQHGAGSRLHTFHLGYYSCLGIGGMLLERCTGICCPD